MYLLIFILLAIGIFSMIFYNRFITGKNRIRDAWSAIDVQLKRRYDLIPNLVETVKGFATHEKAIFESIAAARNAAITADELGVQQEAERRLGQSLRQLFAVAEAYPELKSNDNFRHLQHQLSAIETDIQMARRYYNASVRDYNNSVETFPGNVISGMFGFSSERFFDIGIDEKENPKVSF